MAGAIKHMERSHRSYSTKDAAFRRFTIKAISTKEQKQTRQTVLAKLVNLFKHQDR